ncbi:hypothetical protein [Kushneria phyllosphaerae]|uniref:Uncharacterized protein n=1 Tax=Kushneria phyllosphaerae TaxID=2100822 RepID=A0A2R8CHH2_9GAMM|nr:hypothetical protein [Kushneria phyllosphaerae]SPJ32262.1 hypothetical protein KSP9073_00262 [Kushneria phyllosphaerae]
MENSHESNQLHFFTNNSDILPKPHVITNLLPKLAQFDLMPTYGQEFNPNSGEKRQFIIMMSPDEKIRVEFQLRRIVIVSEASSQQEFKGDAISILKKLYEIYPSKKGNRISILNTRIYEGDLQEYSDLYKKLFTYHQADPFEWENQIAERENIEGSEEVFNCISTIRRCQISAAFMNNGDITDAIVNEIDINTLPTKTEERFDLNNSIQTYEKLFEKSGSSMSKLNRYF